MHMSGAGLWWLAVRASIAAAQHPRSRAARRRCDLPLQGPDVLSNIHRLQARPNARQPASDPAGPRDANAAQIAQTIGQALSAAGLHATGSGSEIRATIDAALTQAGLLPTLPAARTDDVIEGTVVARACAPHAPIETRMLPAPDTAPEAPSPTPPSPIPAQPRRGRFTIHEFGNAAGTRSYKLYVPAALQDPAHAPAPLLLMLHGCTQTPDDFATGTRMNALADAHGVVVVYPAQTQRDNGSRCWNWFRRQDQAHGRGEPALLAGLVQHVASQQRIDPARIYVAGLSAGAAMAVILGETYPQLFAGVGAHSGLPYRAAHDVASAFAAMHGPATATDASAHASSGVPTIVFHGDADRTVADRNGRAIVERARDARATAAPVVHSASTPGGRRYTREVHVDASGRTQAEYWRVHGAAHAWSGGDAQGSYTDPHGPDASAEMLRFFLQHRRAAC